eukprot:3933766-Amphidinium_carterae.1
MHTNNHAATAQILFGGSGSSKRLNLTNIGTDFEYFADFLLGRKHDRLVYSLKAGSSVSSGITTFPCTSRSMPRRSRPSLQEDSLTCCLLHQQLVVFSASASASWSLVGALGGKAPKSEMCDAHN